MLRLRCRRLAQWDSENPTPSPAKFKEREELDKQLQGLKGLQKSFTERGPIYDVVAFHDGTVWRAALDASQVCCRQLLIGVRFPIPLVFGACIIMNRQAT